MWWNRRPRKDRPRTGALPLAAGFALLASLVVVTTNLALDAILLNQMDPAEREHIRIETLADLVQVIPTTLLIFVLLRRELQARERIAAAHRASEQRLRNLLETATDAIVGLDGDYRIYLFNRGAERLFGYEAGEICGQHMELLAPGSTIGTPAGPLLELPQPWEIACRRKDGTIFPAEAGFSEMREDSGKLFTVILHDISQRKAAEEALLRSREDLEIRVQERTEQLFREARRVASLVERQKLARELHDSVSQALYGIALGTHAASEMSRSGANRLDETLEYVRDLARLAQAEMRSLIFQLRPGSIEKDGLIAALSELAEAINVGGVLELRLNLCPEPDLSLEAKESIYRICQEALRNTTKHARARTVSLRLDLEENQIVLEVIDDGIGFDAGASFPGHLGLESMRERASSLGGNLDIESLPGRGTRVVARISTTAGPGVSASIPVNPAAG